MWTPATRAQHSRDSLRFATDLTDEEFAVVEPVFPGPAKTRYPRKFRQKLEKIAVARDERGTRAGREKKRPEDRMPDELWERRARWN